MTPQDPQQQKAFIESVSPGADTVREQDKIMLVLAYLGILSLIPLLTVKDSEFVSWHAKQGLVFSLGGGILVAILGAVLGWIPFLGPISLCTMFVGYFVVNIMAMVKAVKGERWRIPVAADVASKL